MTTFLLTVAILGALEVLGTLWHLARGTVPVRTAGSMALNAAIMAGYGVWALVLLLTGAA